MTGAPCSACPRQGRRRCAGRSFPVTDFGAKGDGTTLNTQAFAKAIAACHRAGGGHVIVPAGGAFLTDAIHLRSHVDLHVKQDATILFSQNPADYSPFVYCYGQRNVAVTGAGTLNGQAGANNCGHDRRPAAADPGQLQRPDR